MNIVRIVAGSQELSGALARLVRRALIDELLGCVYYFNALGGLWRRHFFFNSGLRGGLLFGNGPSRVDGGHFWHVYRHKMHHRQGHVDHLRAGLSEDAIFVVPGGTF